MGNFTQQQITDQIAAWTQASVDLATNGVAYTIKDRSETMTSAEEITKMLDFWCGEQDKLSGNTANTIGFVGFKVDRS